MYHPTFNPNRLEHFNYKRLLFGLEEQGSSLQAYVQSFKASIQIKILSNIYNLNFSQTPSEKFLQEQSGIDKETFNYYLNHLQQKQKVLKVGEVNGLGYYRISLKGVITLQKLSKKLNEII